MAPMEPYKLIELFLSERDVEPISKRQYGFNLRRFFIWVINQGKQYTELGKADILNYKVSLQHEGKTHLTIANYMITLRLFYKWMAANDIAQDLTVSIRINKSYHTFRKKSLDVSQSVKLLSTFDTTTLKGKRDYAIANLMLRNGLREIEVVRMNIQDVTEYNGCRAINIQRKGKIEKDATLPTIGQSNGGNRRLLTPPPR
jgi:integrase/recombinase XerD